eukprot:354029-Chlamydomonas_euryale.AAC.4
MTCTSWRPSQWSLIGQCGCRSDAQGQGREQWVGGSLNSGTFLPRSKGLHRQRYFPPTRQEGASAAVHTSHAAASASVRQANTPLWMRVHALAPKGACNDWFALSRCGYSAPVQLRHHTLRPCA